MCFKNIKKYYAFSLEKAFFLFNGKLWFMFVVFVIKNTDFAIYIEILYLYIIIKMNLLWKDFNCQDNEKKKGKDYKKNKICN